MRESARTAAGESGQGPPLRVLVVDDSRAQRKILSVSLQRAGYAVTEAGSAEAALALCRTLPFDIVLSDWVMPGMSGLDLCRAFRALPREGYGYFVLLTSKSEKAEVADGLDCGADDFLTKPVSAGELRARLRAGERVIAMQAELVETNRMIGRTLGELRALYDGLDRDLVEARTLQHAMMPARHRDFGGGSVSLLLRPSGHVGGDLAGYFPLRGNRIAMFSVDVSGHGVASAMLTARLAGLLGGGGEERSIALARDAQGRCEAWPPEMVAARLNRLMLESFRIDQYFTLAYAEIDLSSGRAALVQAGHPHPAVIRAGGGVEWLGSGGLPVGLIPGAAFERVETRLFPGDRLFLMSDGVTECPDAAGAELGTEGLARLIAANAGLPPQDFLDALVWDLSAHRGGADFPDDVSGALFHYRG